MSKITHFFREVISEMRKVTWPTRRNVAIYTLQVVVFSVVMAAILGAADFGLLKLVNLILK